MQRFIGFIAALALLAVAPLGALAAQQDDEAPEVGNTLAALILDTDDTIIGVALLAEGTFAATEDDDEADTEATEDADEDAEDEDGVVVGVFAVGLAPGAHGIHIHETGICDPTGDRAFASAGGHYNPTGEEHGDHAGDLGNITADEDGTANFQETTDDFGLDELLDEDGTSIVIHAEEDENDEAGESFGARIACGVLAAPVADAAVTTATVAAEPTATVAAAPEPTVTEPAAPEPTVTEPAADVDTDEDGLTDADETNTYGTDPANPDTDGDGVTDGDEVTAGTDPLDEEDM